MAAMDKYEVPELWGRVFSVGTRDPAALLSNCDGDKRRGTTYNAYLVIGKKKSALVGCVPRERSQELMGKVDQLVNLSDLAYIIIQNWRPEHCGALLELLSSTTGAIVMTTGTGREELLSRHHLPSDQVHAVKAGNRLELGDRHLEFVELYGDNELLVFSPDNGMLFSGEFFGEHIAEGICDEDVDDILGLARANFDRLLADRERAVEEVLGVARGFDVRVIAPAHGVVFKNPRKILDCYQDWLRLSAP